MSWIEKTAQRIWPGRQAPQKPSVVTEENTLAKIEESSYPSNVTGILETLVGRFAGTNGEKAARELAQAQTALTVVLHDGIQAFKEYAQASGKEWQGSIQGPHSLVDQDGLSEESEVVRITDKSISYLSTLYVEGWNPMDAYHREIELIGSADGQTVTGARYSLTKTEGYGSDKKQTTIKHMSVNFGSPGEPSEVHFISKPDPVKNRTVTQFLEYQLTLGS